MLDYHTYLRSDKWRDKRLQVMIRCKGVCEQCHFYPVDHIHHLTYDRFGNEHLDDLQGLCVDCHQAKHPHRTFCKNWLTIPSIAKRLNQSPDSVQTILDSLDAHTKSSIYRANKQLWCFERVQEIVQDAQKAP